MPTPRKHPKLMNIKWVYEQLQKKSMRQLAEELECTHSSVRWIVDRYFSDKMREEIIYERKHENRPDCLM